MTPNDIVQLLGAACICGEEHLEAPIRHAFAADLMSDVLRLNTENMLLITGMANLQVIRTAEMSDIPFILFVRDKKVTPEMKELAQENGYTGSLSDWLTSLVGATGADGKSAYEMGRE